MVNQNTAKWAGKIKVHKNEVDSTNEVAKRAGNAGAEHGSIFVADRQTAGKGRRGREWYSSSEDNLYFTILLRAPLEPQKAAMLTLVMALAVADGVAEYTGLEAEIKWPNDIVVHGRKVCGILSEMKLDGISMEYCVVGVGVNVGNQNFPADIRDMATSLEAEKGMGISKEILLQRILVWFEEYYEIFMEKGNLNFLQKKYNTRLINRDKQVRVLDPKGEYEGVAKGISEDGELLIELPDGSIQKVYAGEVSVRGLYGYV